MKKENSLSVEESSKAIKRAAYVALPHSLPILAGYGFLGLAYGISMSVHGFHPLYSILMSVFLFGGSRVQLFALGFH